MLNKLGYLTEEEAKEFYLVPIWVCILIAGADSKIDRSEIKKAIKLAKDKTKKEHALIIDYYKKAAQNFEVNLRGYITLMPQNDEKRIDFLVAKLDRVNYFFSKLEKELAYQLYLSFRDFAYKIAQASGGIFGLLSVSFAESKYIDLKMIKDPSEQSS